MNDKFSSFKFQL